MATYTYNCKKCDKDRDVKHGMTEAPVIVCEDCNYTMSKVIRSVNFQLKGSGWFKQPPKRPCGPGGNKTHYR